MKRAYLIGAICIGLASTGPALARTGWTTPVNGKVSAMMTSNGDVMMEITLPAAEFQGIGRDMKISHDTCIIKDTDTGTPNSMILVCGLSGSKVQ